MRLPLPPPAPPPMPASRAGSPTDWPTPVDARAAAPRAKVMAEQTGGMARVRASQVYAESSPVLQLRGKNRRPNHASTPTTSEMLMYWTNFWKAAGQCTELSLPKTKSIWQYETRILIMVDSWRSDKRVSACGSRERVAGRPPPAVRGRKLRRGEAPPPPPRELRR